MSDGSGKAIHSKTGLRKLKQSFREQRSPIELAFFLQDWEDAYNVGGMFRVADACAARELVMSGRTPVPPDPMISVTSMGHHRRIPFRKFQRHEEAATALADEGYRLVAVELADDSVSYQEFEYPRKLCLVLGNEVNGVYTSVMRHRDASVHIPMFGKGRSLNVHVAAAIVAFEALTRVQVAE